MIVVTVILTEQKFDDDGRSHVKLLGRRDWSILTTTDADPTDEAVYIAQRLVREMMEVA